MRHLVILAKPEGSVYSRIYKAKERLRRRYGIHYDVYPHVTLYAGKQKDLEAVVKKFLAMKKAMAPFVLEISGVGCWKPETVYLKVRKTRQLSGINRMLSASLGRDFSSADKYNNPKMWKPHVTLIKCEKPGQFDGIFSDAKKLNIKSKHMVHSIYLADYNSNRKPSMKTIEKIEF